MKRKKTYCYQIPPRQYGSMNSREFDTLEECIDECKRACVILNVDYDDRDVKLFMTDIDGVWEVTEEGELAG